MSAPGGGLQDLNALPLSPTDIDEADVTFNPDDLAIFTNTRFFDFDTGPDERRNQNREGGETGRTDLIDPELRNGGMDFLNEFDPYGYDTYPFGPTQHTPSSPSIDRSFTPSLVSPATRRSPAQQLVPLPPSPAPLSEASSPGQSPHPSRNNMRARKASTANSSDHIQSPSSEQFGDEPSSRSAAVDEDKRRRNTAASARFRVKKKEKEAQLAKDAKDAAEKVRLMEARIKKLEEQNEWLKSLLLEKKRAVPPVTKNGDDGNTPSGNDSGEVLK